jgi:tRNA (guanine-N7-)-methyltransferase
VGKNKLRKFAENKTFSNLFQPSFDEVWGVDYPMKGKWNSSFFNNPNPIVLELGCGKGEYTINLAKTFPNKNFIGVDIKGARLWKGAKEAHDSSLKNVAFIRTRIENISSFFAKEEVSEIWITFPDPQPRPSKARKRLSSSRFLSYYQKFVKNNGLIHLKTDSQELHGYTKALVDENCLRTLICTNDLYTSGIADEILSIRTFYESMFLDQGKPITYINFELNGEKKLTEPTVEQC